MNDDNIDENPADKVRRRVNLGFWKYGSLEAWPTLHLLPTDPGEARVECLCANCRGNKRKAA